MLRSADEILNANFGEYLGQESFIHKMKSTINDARIEAIKECAEKAKTQKVFKSGYKYDTTIVNKQSILSIINEVK